MKARDVYLADLSATASSDTKIRPVLVVSDERFNRGDDVVVIPISHSADPSGPFAIQIAEPDYRLSGLKKEPSSAMWTKPIALPKRILVRRLGHIGNLLFDEIREKLRSVFSHPEP